MRKLTLIFLMFVLAGGFALVRPADARAEDTAAVAINTKDGSSLFRLAFSIQRAAGAVVDNQNAAVAYASCSDCQTVAISIQVVFAIGDANVVTTENYAIAVNQQCTMCETLASAYQFVFGTGGPVHFTAEGNQAIAQLRREFQQLRQESENLTIAEIQARVDALLDRLYEVLKTELVKAGDAPPPRTNEQGTQQGTATTPTSPGETTPTTTETTPTATTETTPTETTPTTTDTTTDTTTETTETTTTP